MKRTREAQTIIYNLAALFYYDHLCSSRFVSHPPWHFKQKDASVQFSPCFHQVMLCLVISSHVWCDMARGAMELNPINRGTKDSPGGPLMQSWGSGPLTAFWTATVLLVTSMDWGRTILTKQDNVVFVVCIFSSTDYPVDGSGRWYISLTGHPLTR